MPRVLIDCRWVSWGGAGTLTRRLLEGLAQGPPDGEWVLWGPSDVARLAWPGAEVVPTAVPPNAAWGQRSWLDVPRSDLALYLHQQRPLRPGPSVTVILDTISLRYNAPPASRRLKRVFLRGVVALSREIVTISEHSRAAISRDLGVDPDRITVVSLPLDERFAAEVERLRAEAEVAPVNTALYVGAFLPHKNLPRLVSAFSRSRFKASGGRLTMVGGSASGAAALRAQLPEAWMDGVTIEPRCSEQDLARHFARALFLVQPSLEEGFGLPVLEALSCGLPVCVSDGGALPEITKGLADPFPAVSEEAMTAALDDCADRAAVLRASGGYRRVSAADLGRPTVREYAAQFVDILARNLT